MKLVLAIVVGTVAVPLILYIIGRIILPAAGLIAPPYSAWFWSWWLGVILYAIKVGIQEVLLD